MASRCLNISSVIQLQSKLYLSRWRASRSDLTKVGTVEVTGVRNRDDPVAPEVRSIEVRMVEYVEELRPELE